MELIGEGKVSHSIAYQRLFPAMLEQPEVSALFLAESLELIQNKDEGLLEELANQLLAQFPDKVLAYKKGKKGLIGFFMGQLMKASKGQADPVAAKKLLEEKLK